MKALIGMDLSPALVRKMSNDCAFLSITEETGEGLEMLGFYH